MSEDLLVSCLMVSRPLAERLAPFKASIAAYLRQDYSNRELVILLNRGDSTIAEAMAAHVASLQREDIRLTVEADSLTLGQLRNLSIEYADGEIFCQWDDDDLHHPNRISEQLKFLLSSGAEAVLLQDVFQYFPAAAALYWTNWAMTEAQGHPGTLMARKSSPAHYPDLRMAEDLAVALAYHKRGVLSLMPGCPHLFVYVSHGANTWSDEHHLMLAEQLSLSPGLLKRRETLVRDGVAPFDLKNRGIGVFGKNVRAFDL